MCLCLRQASRPGRSTVALVGLSFALLTHAFVVQDFSVAYVAQNSNSDLPMLYRYSAVWGAHEGSLLLWALILSIWTAVVALRTRALPDAFVARVLSVLGFVAVGFLLFTILTSNPFLRHVPGLLVTSLIVPAIELAP